MLEQNLSEASKRYAQLKDDNVIRFYGASRAFGYLPGLILEFCDKGNVIEYLKGSGDCVAESTQQRLVSLLLYPSNAILKRHQVKEVSSGLHYLHSQNIVHGDLRAVCDPFHR